jgi:hypothetical protein
MIRLVSVFMIAVAAPAVAQEWKELPPPSRGGGGRGAGGGAPQGQNRGGQRGNGAGNGRQQ